MSRKRKGDAVHGWLILDKPEGPSSAAVVGRVKRLFNAAKVGHGGTLDPLASGVLPLAFGEATKTVSFAMEGRKRYRFTIRWGEATSTDDREGDVIARGDARPEEAAIRAALPAFVGEISQRPPAFSAIKLDGRRAYDLARAGEVVSMAERTVEVTSLEVLEIIDADHAVFEMGCGKGVYVRSIARDLALALGTVGHVSTLRRTAVGRFDESRAIALDFLETLGHGAATLERLLPISTVLDDIPALAVTEAEAKLIRAGQSITPTAIEALGAPRVSGDPIRAMLDREPVALGQWVDGRFAPTRVFNL